MTHESYRELIQREIDGDLTAEEVAVLEQHVAACADCHRTWNEYKTLAVTLEKLEFAKPERSFVSQMAPSDLAQFVVKPKRRVLPPLWRGLSVAAVVVLAVGVSTHWNFFLDKTSNSGQQVAVAPDKT